MNRHTKHTLGRILVSLLVVLAAQVAQAFQYEILAYGILQLEEDDDRCAVVKVHSVVKNSEEESFHQSGMGWFTISAKHDVGVLTPYHVIAESSAVFGECNGKLFELAIQKVDAEKDLAYLTLAEDIEQEIAKIYYPVIWQRLPGEKTYRDKLKDETRAVLDIQSPPIPESEYRNNIKGLALTMSSYGVASAPDLSDRSKSLILSQDFDLSVEAIVDEAQPLAKNLIRVDGLGIKPGLSGSVLFGVAGNNSRLHRIDWESKKAKKSYGLPVQWMPKVVLGMVTKTRLNGAETVAISMGDIIDFMNTIYSKSKDTKLLETHFVPNETASGLELIPVLALDDTLFYEYCGDNYKNSGSLTPLVKQTPPQSPPSFFSFNKKEIIVPVENKILERIQKGILPKSESRQLKIDIHPQFKNQRTGGGDYGEGGEGFMNSESEFVLTSLPAHRIEGIKDSFKNIKQYQSRGIYKSVRTCRQEGLFFNKKLISSVALPNGIVERLATFEDLRVFTKKHGKKSLELITNFGSNEGSWPYANHPELEQPLRVPLLSASSLRNKEAEPFGNNPFFQHKFIPRALSATPVSSYYMISRGGLELSAAVGHWKLDLSFLNSQWNGAIQFSQDCKFELKPENFKMLHSWKSQYKDQNLDLSISLGSMDELVRLNVNQVTGCNQPQKLVLGQFIVYGRAGAAPVIGSARTAVVPMSFDLPELKKIYQSPENSEVPR